MNKQSNINLIVFNYYKRKTFFTIHFIIAYVSILTFFLLSFFLINNYKLNTRSDSKFIRESH